MTLGALENHIKEMREQGATDDSEVRILDMGDLVHIEHIEFDNEDVIIIPE